tara:strand:- start:183 stop:311 length:129 start_codon:yes stop_codon:yes gene_type:complete
MNFTYQDVKGMTREDRLAFYEIFKKEAEKQQEIREELSNSSK